MVRVKPFAAVRPPQSLVKEVASRPYDVLNSSEAQAEASEKSLLHITRPEIDFHPLIDEHDSRVYDKAVENFRLWQEKGWLVQDSKPQYYIYAQTMDGRTQYGLVLCAHTDDYAEGKIKKHELTRKEKEDDRMIHVRIQNANIEPVFFAYPDDKAIDAIVDKYVQSEPEYDFVSDDGVGHKFWVIGDDGDIAAITAGFEGIHAFYVADGHHRTAAAARVGAEKKEAKSSEKSNKAVKKDDKGLFIIVSSLQTMADAEKELEKFKKQGYSEASILTSDNRFRIALYRYNDKSQAYGKINELRKEEQFKSAWLLDKSK